MSADNSAAIAHLNDAARTSFIGCRVVITRGIAAMDDLDGLYAKVRAFEDFTERNDPYGEHDFGSVEHEGQTVFWKFDYYDVNRRPKGTHYRRGKGNHLGVWRWVDGWRAFRAGGDVGRA